jgi:hypothetical protein
MSLLLLRAEPAASKHVSVIYKQLISGEFRQFDFGEEKNMELYGQPTPPQYNLSLATAPVALFHSDNDKLAPPYVRQICLRFLEYFILHSF